MAKAPTEILSHWYQLIEGLQASPLRFYESIEAAIDRWRIPDAKISRIDWREGGIGSAKRVYLRVKRGDHVIDICGAPFGNGFFVSEWLGELPTGCIAFLAEIPYLGLVARLLLRPATYSRSIPR